MKKKKQNVVLAVMNPKGAEKLIKDMTYLIKLLKLKFVARDRHLEEMFKNKYNIKLEYKKKNGSCYYICNKSDKELAGLIQTTIK